MKITHKFDYRIETLEYVNDWIDLYNYIRNEPMIFSGSWYFSYENGGPITKSIMNRLRKYLPRNLANNIVIDTRVTHTMKGQYPSIPGWHGDDIPRSTQYGQPYLPSISKDVQHFMVLLSDVESNSCTEFVTDRPELEFDYESEIPIWGQLDQQINAGNYKTKFIRAGELIRFDQNAIHRASPTINPGWRFFFRLSLTHRIPANEIRKQVQVYSNETMGW